jgi:glycerol kinase
MTDKPVLRPGIIETTALGAAYLAGLHVGIFKTVDDIAAAWQCERTFTPDMPKDTRTGLYQGWQKAVKQVLAGV